MAKQPEEWHYLNPEFDDTSSEEEEEEEIIWVSKSEIKRDAEALKKLGTELVELSAQELERIPLDEKLLASIQLAQKVQREARRRQIQYIGKLLRNVDEEPIRQALDKLKNRHNQQILVLHKLEDLRIRLVEGVMKSLKKWSLFTQWLIASNYVHLSVMLKKKKKRINHQNHSAYCFNTSKIYQNQHNT